jgi:hypothetical protein
VSLQTKILQLKLDAALAVRHANGWQRLIDTYGLEKATAFYQHLGLNHLESKSYDYDGLKLSREPKGHEKLAVKGVAQAQESSKVAISNILLGLRTELITDGIDGIRQLGPATYHELVLDAPAQYHASLREKLIAVHRRGRQLVGQEIERQQGKAWLGEGSWQHPVDFDVVHKRNRFGPHDKECIGFECKCDIKHQPKCAMLNGFPTCSCEFKQVEDEFDELDDLVDLTTSRVVNDTQARIIAAAARYALLGLSGSSLITSVTNDINTGSVSYIDRAASGVSNRVINIGRHDEFENRADEIDRFEQSALLDPSTCEPCFEDDGKTATNPDDLPGGPNPDCLGSDYCRCFVVAIVD